MKVVLSPVLLTTAISPEVSRDRIVGTEAQAGAGVPLPEAEEETRTEAQPHDEGDRAVILVVDDEEQIRDLIGEILGGEYTVLRAADGVEAIDILKRRRPDLIISDISMPNLDGLGLLRYLKENEITRYIPFVFLTFKTDVEQEIHGYELGGIIVAGLIMGLSYGFFWANRDFLALSSTDDGNRNYYYGLESFFNTVASVVVPGMIGAFLGATADHGWFAGNINFAYKLVTVFVFVLTIVASAVVCRGRFASPARERFVYFRFDRLWNKMMRLAVLKGIAQGYIVTAPSMLVMTLVGNETTLGTLQSIGALVSAVLLYLLGRFTSSRHRVAIFSAGLLLFALGGAFNAVLYSATGVIVFMLCLVLGRPLMDLGYFPIQLRVIDYVSRKENRNSYAYIFIHEFALYLGRFFGCGLFIALTICLSDTFAIRYALLIIGAIQLISISISRDITQSLDRLERK